MDSTKESFISEIAQVILESVNITYVETSEITAETPLMGGILELDSVDLLEAVIAIEDHYDIKIANAEEGKESFRTFGTIANFIQSKRNS